MNGLGGLGMLLLLLSLGFGIVNLSIHRVTQGHVGIYYRGGALTERITQPGWHFKLPFIDSYEEVQVTMQTDKVQDIPCGTSGGVLIWIERVEVVNRLKEALVYETIKNYTVNYDKIWIFDKIHHEINQFCSSHTLQEVYIDLFNTVDERLQSALQTSCDTWAPGIEIIAIRITKPRIPDGIARNYEAMEAEKTKLLVAEQAQKVAKKEAETQKLKEIVAAEKEKEVSLIRMQQKIAESESERRMQEIADEIYLHKQKTETDSVFYRKHKEAEANQLVLTDKFLQHELIKSMGNNTKVYFGDSLATLWGQFVEFFDKGKSTISA